MDKDVVYYGSPRRYRRKYPKQSIREKEQDGSNEEIFRRVCFHATPLYWIALAYTYESHPEYNIGVNLYENEKTVAVFGEAFQEEILHALYGSGGYLHTFAAEPFFSVEGLGTYGCISEVPLQPLEVERIDNPVAAMRKKGVDFVHSRE